MADKREVSGFDDFFLNAKEIRSSVDDLVEDGIVYNVQCNIARSLLSVNEKKASGEAFVRIGLSDFIKQTYGDEFLYGLRVNIFGEKAIKDQPASFVDAQSKPEVFLEVLSRSINDLVERGFVCRITNEFGLVAGQKEHDLEIPYDEICFPNEVPEATNTQLKEIFHRCQQYVLSLDGDAMTWVERNIRDTTDLKFPDEWLMIFAPCLGLLITW